MTPPAVPWRSSQARAGGTRQRRRRRLFRAGSIGASDLVCYLALLPVLALFAYVRVIPIVWSVVLSFYRLESDRPREAVHRAGATTSACSLTRISGSRSRTPPSTRSRPCVVSTVLALPLAVFLARKSRLSAIYQTIYFLPVITPMVPMAIAWKWIYDYNYGILNYVLSLVGIRRRLADRPAYRALGASSS